MIRLTDEQAAAAHADAKAIAVIAGAGTGKTRVLTRRYLHLVLEKGVAIPRILALTFTEKAAREMKERIREALREAGRPDLARDAEFAPISTIHAFLSRVLRERALDAELDPRFVIADEITAQLYLEESQRQTIDSLAPDPRAALVDLTGGEEAFVDLYLAARATPFEMHELRPAALDDPTLQADMSRFLEQCDAAPAGTPKLNERLATLRAGRDRFAALDPSSALEFKSVVGGNVPKAHKDLFALGRALRDRYLPLRFQDRAAATGAALQEALIHLDETYTARKRADGYLDFADLEREGYKLLRSPAGEAVAAEFDHLLVDEYQDTSRIQQAILDELSKTCSRFGVGDEKQSIYRFRYADAAVFRELQDHAERYPLGGSFRSRPEVVGFTNELFRRLFADRDVEPQDLLALAEWREANAPCVELLAPEAGNSAEGHRLEAAALAERLRKIVQDKELEITNASKKREPLTYRHCALLLRAMTHLPVYERALIDAGVPYVVLKGRGYYGAREVVDVAHLLWLLADPLDDFRGATVLTSLLCGVPDSDLLHLQTLAKGEPLPLRALRADRPAAIPQERWERLETFARRFERWTDLAGRVETGDLLETIYEETALPALYLSEPNGRRRYANLMKVLRRARQTREDPLTYSRSLLEFREREYRESEAPIAAETDEAVKIMTVHAAKGLEFPLVAVADLGGGQGGTSRPILKPDGVFGFKLRGEKKSEEPPGYDAVNQWEKTQEANERLRLLYVAATRAEEHLLLSGYLPERPAEILKLLIDEPPEGLHRPDLASLIARRPRRREAAAVMAAVRRMKDLPQELERDQVAADDLLRRIEERPRRATDTSPYVAAVADLVEYHRCPRRYRLKRMLGVEFDDPAHEGDRSDAEEHPRRALGTAFHEVMNEIGPGAVPDEAMVKKHMPGARTGDVRKIVQWSEWLSKQALTKRVSGEEQQREMPFLTRVGGLPVRGVIDLYVPSLPLLLDYKTGRTVRAEEYGVQVAVYLAALRGLGLPAPNRAHLVYVDAEEIVEVEDRRGDDLAARFTEAHADAGSFPPVPGDSCLHCEFRKACTANGVACPQPGLF